MINNLPSSWSIAKLGDICETTSGGTPSRKRLDYYNGNIPWLKSGELNNNVIFEAEEFINEDALKNSSAKIFPKGTLLVALYGATVGKLGILGIQATTNQAICGIFESKIIDTMFLYYLLFFNRPTLLEERIGGAQPNISQLVIRNLSLVIPPLKEQHRIVSKLEELFSQLDIAVAELKKAKEQIKTYKQSVLKYAFKGKLTIDNSQLTMKLVCRKVGNIQMFER
jgi:type I restriction enzyme S subunit